MKELGPRGWEIRAAVIKGLRQKERSKYIRMLQRSILLCPKLRIESTWKEIRPLVKHTEGYAVLPEEHCKKVFRNLMERLREGRPRMQQRRYNPRTIVLTRGTGSRLARQARLRSLPKDVREQRRMAISQAEKPVTKRTPRPVKTIPIVAPKAPAALAAERKKTRMAEHERRQKKEMEEKRKRIARAQEAGIQNARARKTKLS
jgi:hypothetical protein